jgi:hypothetical protein
VAEGREEITDPQRGGAGTALQRSAHEATCRGAQQRALRTADYDFCERDHVYSDVATEMARKKNMPFVKVW